jgi:hypothetical protein
MNLRGSRHTVAAGLVLALLAMFVAVRFVVSAPAFRSLVLQRPDEVTSPTGTTLSAAAQEIQKDAVDAYVYGYPLVTIEMTRRVMTNVEKPETTRAPMGQLVRMRSFPTAAFKDVTAPNVDTLYTTAFFEVGREPWVLTLPDAHGRYYLMPMLDAWTNVFEAPGKRTTGTGKQTYAITGPDWKGTLPAGVKAYRSPTNIVRLMGRIYCSGTPEDYVAVHKMQDEMSLLPLSEYGKPYAAPLGTVDPQIDMKTPVRDQVNALTAAAYFNLLAQLMKDNPPAAADAPMVAKLARLGIVPGQVFDSSQLGAAGVSALEDVPRLGLARISGWTMGSIQAGVSKVANSWVFTTRTGVYGTDYLQRALITYLGVSANLPDDAIYPTSLADASGQPYIGTNTYVIHFNKDQFPPVHGFWSLTMYDEQFFFVANPLDRYTLSERNKFHKNADGSVDLYLQHDNPGSLKEDNWLPAPDGPFVLMLRLYWPKETPPSILDGTWKPPVVEKVTQPVLTAP